MPLKDRFPIDAWTDPNYQEWFERHKASAETLNAQRGRRIVTSPNVRLHTADRCPGERYNATKNCPEFSEADTRRYDEKWPDARKGGDNFVNPNLDQASEYFQVQGSPLVNVESETSE